MDFKAALVALRERLVQALEHRQANSVEAWTEVMEAEAEAQRVLDGMKS